MSQTPTDIVTDHAQGGKWEFNESVTACFDEMLARSIPQYDVMRQACFDIAARYVKPKTSIVDIGCSRGAALAPFIEKFGAGHRFVGLDVSKPMLAAARERFKGYIDCGIVDIREHDLRQGLPHLKPSVVLSILTLQFTPIEYRQRIVADIYKTLEPGGALILVEKVLGATADIDTLMVGTYYSLKGEHGYTQEQIAKKRASLEGVLVPVTAKWNEELLRMAGFTQVDCFWRWMSFAGWVAVKGA